MSPKAFLTVCNLDHAIGMVCVCMHAIVAKQEARQMIIQCRVQISILSVTFRNAIYSGVHRNDARARS